MEGRTAKESMKPIHYIRIVAKTPAGAHTVWECSPTEANINNIPNPLARMLAGQVAKDGKERKRGKWSVKAYRKPHAECREVTT
jgi:hypothetical protein